ncbi:MAG: 50S ribosomal protein L11 methyltransferase, partial [Bacteroidota bacterium]
MKKIYISLRISMPEELFEQAVALLSVFPFTGIEELTDEIEITFNREDYNPAIREEITALIKNLHSNSEIVSENEIRERNWNEEWEKNLTPVLIGDVAITPEIKKDEV